MSVNEKMTAIANEVRILSGVADKLSLDQMASHTKDANTEVDTQESLIQQIKTALQGKSAVGDAEPVIHPLEVTETGTYTAPNGVDGYSPVVVDVPIPEGYIVPNGELEVTENGTHDVTKYSSVNVKVPTGEIKPDPSKEYQRVVSITNTGNAYFQTDIVADNSTGAELTASYATREDCVPMGSATSTSNTRFFVPYLLSASSIYYGFNTGTSMTFSSSVDTKYTASINFRNSRTAMLYDANGLAKVGQAVTRSVTQQTAPITILCYRTPSGKGASRKCTMYGARISQGEEIVRDYVPCYRKSDDEIGLYDMCTGTFLPNSGTDPLTKGDDIEWDAEATASAYSLRQYTETDAPIEVDTDLNQNALMEKATAYDILMGEE